jgi:hypothetical protein
VRLFSAPFAHLFVTRIRSWNLARIAMQFQYTFTDDHLRRFGHHIGQRAAVLGVVKALRCAPTRYAGLRAWTTPARRSKCSTHVMAGDPLHFQIDPVGKRAYVAPLVGAVAHPLRSRIRRGALQPPPSGQGLQHPSQQTRSLA